MSEQKYDVSSDGKWVLLDKEIQCDAWQETKRGYLSSFRRWKMFRNIMSHVYDGRMSVERIKISNPHSTLSITANSWEINCWIIFSQKFYHMYLHI